MKQKFLRFIKEHHLFDKSNKILVAVSGGADSMTLLHLLHECGFTCGVAHCNFQLRGGDSDSDAEFVRQSAKKISIPFHYKKFDTKIFASENKISQEMAARELRYHWFEEVRKEFKYLRIVTAHHLNDSTETFFLNLFRGTGIEGLKGISPRRNYIVRPLLFAARREILDYIQANKIEFRTDQTNFNTEIERNWVRHELIPLIEEKYPALLLTMEKNMQYLGDAALFYDQKTRVLLKKWLIKSGEEEKIPCAHVLHHPGGKSILHEWLHPSGFNSFQIADIFESLNEQPGKQFFSATHQLLKDRKYLVLAPASLKDLSEHLIYIYTEQIELFGFSFGFKLIENNDIVFKEDNSVQFLDYDSLEFPLILRRWRKGDYFYPLGMKRKKKKVSDFLIDKKVRRSDKDRCFVLQSGDYIAAIINMQIDERFRITPESRKVYQITALSKK